MNNVLAYAYGETLEFSTGGGCSSSENLERHWMGLPLACKDADFLRPLPETVAEQRLSCDSSGEHEIWKCSFVHPLLHAEHSLFNHPLLNLVQELYQLSRGTTDE